MEGLLSQSTGQSEQQEEPELAVIDVNFPIDLSLHQRNDPTLAECFKQTEGGQRGV